MTISQLLETVLGKSCCIEGTFGDATPFTSNSTNIAEQICDRLQKNGYERHGWERMINGMTGEMIEAQILIGPCFYQRLKHMVSDKVSLSLNNHLCIFIITLYLFFLFLQMHSRSQGLVTSLTRQPLKSGNFIISVYNFSIKLKIDILRNIIFIKYQI